MNNGQKKLLNSALGLALITMGGNASATLLQWDSGSGGNDHWYETVETPNGISWSDAQTQASASGGYLVTIRSLQEQNFIFDNITVKGLDTLEYQSSYWTGGVANVTDPTQLTLGTPTSWHWNNGESWDYQNFSGADADGLDTSATGGTTTQVISNFTTFIPEVETILASYARISAHFGNWSDQPLDGILDFMSVDALTGDITTPLTEQSYIYGYIIEHDSILASAPEPGMLVLMCTGLAGLFVGCMRKKNQYKLTS